MTFKFLVTKTEQLLAKKEDSFLHQEKDDEVQV